MPTNGTLSKFFLQLYINLSINPGVDESFDILILINNKFVCFKFFICHAIILNVKNQLVVIFFQDKQLIL